MIGHMASNCHNDAQHIVGGGVECAGTAYPRRSVGALSVVWAVLMLVKPGGLDAGQTRRS